jgi:UPF0042 nucleotide-binding protein
MKSKEEERRRNFVLVTGPSGAGRSTALRALEDVGYEIIDNLPLSLFPALLSAGNQPGPIAVGIDARTRDFSSDALESLRDMISEHKADHPVVVYLECRPDILIRRFSETRRRHPLWHVGCLTESIEAELALMQPIRHRSDYLLDTSDLTPHALRSEMSALFGPTDETGLALLIQSFSYGRGLPRTADLVFDCRFLRNPHWQADLRSQGAGLCYGRSQLSSIF